MQEERKCREVVDEVYREVSHLIYDMHAGLKQHMILVYYLYILYVHRQMRGASLNELQRLYNVLHMYQVEILTHFITSKRNVNSHSEMYVVDMIHNNRQTLGVSLVDIDAEQTVVYSVRDLKYIYASVGKIKQMLEGGQSIKDFLTKYVLVPYTFDLLCEDRVLEVNGPQHFTTDLKTGDLLTNGQTGLKQEFIEHIGLQCVDLSFKKVDHIRSLSSQEKQLEYLHTIIINAP